MRRTTKRPKGLDLTNTYITRIWANSRNNFIISDCSESLESVAAGMSSNGGSRIESEEFRHGLGDVFIIQNGRTIMERESFAYNLTHSLLLLAYKVKTNYEFLNLRGIEAQAVKEVVADLIGQVFSVNNLDSRDYEARKIINRYLVKDKATLDKTILDFYEYLNSNNETRKEELE